MYSCMCILYTYFYLPTLRHQLNNELEEVKKVCDDEAKERQSLMGR